MRYVAFDTETYPIVDNGKATTKLIPRMVCMTWAWASEDFQGPKIARTKSAAKIFKRWLDADDVTFIGHNVTFDMLVMGRALGDHFGRDFSKKIFKAYADGRVRDTIKHRKLQYIEQRGDCMSTGHSLKYLTKKYLGEELTGKSGPDVWRMRYNELVDVNLDEWPPAALDYALNDARVTGLVYKELCGGDYSTEVNEYFQLCADLAFYLASSWGIMCDQEWASWIYGHNVREMEKYAKVLEECGIRKDGVNKQKPVREMFRKAWRRLGMNPKRTDSGKNISTAGDTIQELKEHGFFELEGADETLEAMRAYTQYKTLNKQLSSWLDPIVDAGEYPLCARFTTLVNSGRTSSSSPNVQNFPAHLTTEEQRRKAEGDEGPFGPDIRGCFVPRPGRVFMVADYSYIEMASLAQIIATERGGKLSPMGEMLNDQKCPHLYLLSVYRDEPYAEVAARYYDGDEEIADQRFYMKAANYAFGGGGDGGTYCSYMKGFGVNVPRSLGDKLYEAYHTAYPCVRSVYFEYVKSCESGWNEWDLQLHGPRGKKRGWRKRRCTWESQARNAPFQGLVGDGCKQAAWELQQACWTDETSPLYGDRMLLFVHDEFLMEVVDENREETAEEFRRLGVDKGMQIFLPDMDIGFDVKFLDERWQKV